MKEFHEADRDGQIFRYPTDKRGKPHRHEKLPKAISLAALRATMEAAYSLLDGCEDFFREFAADARSEQESD